MADELDRVRISAAELRAEASNLLNSSECHKDERKEGHRERPQRHDGNMHSDLQRYQPVTGHGRSRHYSKGGDTCTDPPGHGCSRYDNKDGDASFDPQASKTKGVGDYNNRSGSSSSTSQPQAAREDWKGKEQSWNNKNHSEAVESTCNSPKAPRKTRKPDREIYQPGSRKGTQLKASGAGREQDKPPSVPPAREGTRRATDTQEAGETEARKDPAPQREGDREVKDPASRREGDREVKDPAPRRESDREVKDPAPRDEREERENSATGKDGGKGREEKRRRERKTSGRGGEASRKLGSRETESALEVSNTVVDNITNRVSKLSIQGDEGKRRGEKGNKEGDNRRRKSRGEEGRRSRAGGEVKQGGEKPDDKKRVRGNQINRGEIDGNLNFGSGWQAEVERAGGDKSEREMTEEERDRKASEGGRSGDTHPPKSRERRNKRAQRANRARDGEREAERDKTRVRERTVEGSERNQASSTATNVSSKRYSKSDIRRPRNRTTSTSSASSSTSLDWPRQGLDEDRIRGDRQRPGGRDRGAGRGVNGGLRRGGGQLQNRSSTDSLEGSAPGDKADDKRIEKRRNGEEDWSPERTQAENKGRGQRRGILRMCVEKQSGTSPAPSEPDKDPQRHRQDSGPCGRGRGILILPAHTNLSNCPEPGPPRLLFGGIRGGGAGGLGRGRGGRGGATRRLWDPNNPDQKPGLIRSPSSQPSGPQQPMYLQTGTAAYAPLHFLDTDDEMAGTPPGRQGEHFQTPQQAAAAAHYKFQNSDNPYCYPVPTGNSNANVAPSPRYPYPYAVSPYQPPRANGMFPSPGGGQFPRGYVGREVTPEEMEQQARGELWRLLRLADAQELQLSNLLSRDRLSSEGLERMAQLRAELLTLYERVILTDMEFSDSQNLDQALWKNVFYQVIERFRQALKDPSADTGSHIRTMLLTLLDEGAVFFDALLQKLQAVFQFKLEDYMDGSAIRARSLRKTVKYALISAQRCLICQGDIARYREQASDSANYGKARSWYLKAQQIAPKNGRPYNQLALLAVYTKRKLDAVYYYMRSLAASNPILTAKESLMGLFEDAKQKADQVKRGRTQESDGGSRGPAVRGGGGRGEDGARVETWFRRSAHTGVVAPRTGGRGSNRGSQQDGELGKLPASDLNKMFIVSFLHGHGKLFTKVGMESFPDVASRVLQEFGALLQRSPCPLGSTRMLQIITINMFTIHNAQRRDVDGEVRSVLQEQTTALGLAMFALLVQRCTELLRDTPAEPITSGEEEEGELGVQLDAVVMVSAFPPELRDLLPSIKVWSDWMLGHPDLWNPPPCSIDGSPDVWRCLADLCNALARVDHEEALLYTVDGEAGEGDPELKLLVLEEDRLLAGFVPLLAAPQDLSFIDTDTDPSLQAIAADCKRVMVLKYFLEALCGQEEPLLAFKEGKYISMATSPPFTQLTNARNRQDSQTERESDDVIVEEELSPSASDGDVDTEEGGASEDNIRELRARRHALTNKLAQHQRRRDKIQEVLQTCGQLQLEVHPLYLVPDTNGFIDCLDGLQALMRSKIYILVVPLIVITELDGLAKGQESGGGGGGSGAPGCRDAGHARALQERAQRAVAFLEEAFDNREPGLRALTSRGNQLESIAFRSEVISGQQGNNDDVILECCLHYCKDKAKDFMPPERNGPVRLRREVVLLTDDRNLRVKALTRNVPVRDIPAFLSWAKVG